MYKRQPNDFFGVASEQYLEIYTDGLWNDIGDNSAGFNNGFVVESVPEPVSVATLAVVGAALLRRRMRV